jgi:hypothetical protein
MPGDGEDATGVDQKPEGQASLIGPLPLHAIEWAVAAILQRACLGLEKTMPTALTAQVLCGSLLLNPYNNCEQEQDACPGTPA